jgi:hypothetical protein
MSAFVTAAPALGIPNATVASIVGQTAHLRYSDGDTAGAVAVIHLPSGRSVYLWPTGKTYVMNGPMTADEQKAVATWLATLKK